jgi:hypothetical protein
VRALDLHERAQQQLPREQRAIELAPCHRLWLTTSTLLPSGSSTNAA